MPLADVGEGARIRVLRFENEAEDLLHYLRATGLEPGLEGTLVESGEQELVIDADGRRCAITRSVAETVSVDRRPLAAAARRAARAARARRQRYGR